MQCLNDDCNLCITSSGQGIGGSDVSASVFHLVSAVSPMVTSYKELRGGWSNVCYVFCFPSHSLDVF